MLFKEYRLKKGYTQEQVSEMTNIDNRTIQRIENEEHLPNMITFSKLVFALDILNQDIMDYLEKLSTLSNERKSK